MNNQYKPIACSLHDEYEVAIMQKKYLNIKWLDDAGVNHTEKVLPKDILVKNKEEFLVARTHHDNAQDNTQLYIRLDKITLLEK